MSTMLVGEVDFCALVIGDSHIIGTYLSQKDTVAYDNTYPGDSYLKRTMPINILIIHWTLVLHIAVAEVLHTADPLFISFCCLKLYPSAWSNRGFRCRRRGQI